MRVYISSGTHVDGLSGRIKAINKELTSPEVVCGEGGEATLSQQAKAILRLLPVAPVVALAATFLIGFYKIVGGVVSILSRGTSGSDRALMNRVAREHEAEIIEIDGISPAVPVYENPIGWSMINWAMVVITVTLFPIGIAFIILLAAGFVLLHIILYLVNSKREDAMAETVASQTEAAEEACVVLGEAHHEGVGERLRSCNGIDVVNPTPDERTILTRVIKTVWDWMDTL